MEFMTFPKPYWLWLTKELQAMRYSKAKVQSIYEGPLGISVNDDIDSLVFRLEEADRQIEDMHRRIAELTDSLWRAHREDPNSVYIPTVCTRLVYTVKYNRLMRLGAPHIQRT